LGNKRVLRRIKDIEEGLKEKEDIVGEEGDCRRRRFIQKGGGGVWVRVGVDTRVGICAYDCYAYISLCVCFFVRKSRTFPSTMMYN